MKIYYAVIAFILISFDSSAMAGESIVLSAARKELDRAMTELGKEELPPYYIAYGITEKSTYSLSASFGNIKNDSKDKSRTLDIDLRVGDYKFDNTHIIRGNSFSFSSNYASTKLPIEDDENALRNYIWYTTDKNYKKSIERYEKAVTNKAVKVEEEDLSDDMSKETPNTYIEDTKTFSIDEDYYKAMLKRVSAKFADNDWLYYGSVSLTASVTNKYFVNTEGSKLQWAEPSYRIFISAKTKADDGMSLPLFKSYFSFTPDGLPDEKTLSAEVDKIISLLDEMRNATAYDHIFRALQCYREMQLAFSSMRYSDTGLKATALKTRMMPRLLKIQSVKKCCLNLWAW